MACYVVSLRIIHIFLSTLKKNQSYELRMYPPFTFHKVNRFQQQSNASFFVLTLGFVLLQKKVSNFDFVPAQNNSTIDFLTKSVMPVQNIVFSVKNNIFTIEEGAKRNL